MDRKSDVVIVGGGVIGLSIAYNLAKEGLGDILLLERERIGRGASSRNLGGIREQFSSEAMTRIMRFSLDLWDDLPRELGWNVLLDHKGYLIVARTEQQLQQLNRMVEMHKRVGVRSRIVSPSEVHGMVPSLGAPDVLGASFNKRDATIHHDAVLWALEEAAKKHGVNMREAVECRGIRVLSGKTAGVETSAGTITAGRVIIAAGAFTKGLASPLGIDLPIKSYSREAMVTEPYKFFMKPVFWDLTTALFLVQTLRGEVLCDTRDPDRGESQETEATSDFSRSFSRQLSELFPSLTGLRLLRSWAGLYDVCIDGSPILGPVNEPENLYFAAGFSGHGMMLSPAVGRLYAEMIGTGRVPDLLRPFRFSRFAEGEQLFEPLIGGRKLERHA